MEIPKLLEFGNIGLTRRPSHYNISGFNLVSVYGRPSGLGGGTAIYLSKELEHDELLHLAEMSATKICEVATVYIHKLNAIV